MEKWKRTLPQIQIQACPTSAQFKSLSISITSKSIWIQYNGMKVRTVPCLSILECLAGHVAPRLQGKQTIHSCGSASMVGRTIIVVLLPWFQPWGNRFSSRLIYASHWLEFLHSNTNSCTHQKQASEKCIQHISKWKHKWHRTLSACLATSRKLEKVHVD